MKSHGVVSVFRGGDAVEIRFNQGNTTVSLHGTLAQVVRPLLEVHLNSVPPPDASLKQGMTVAIAITSGTGIYTADVTVQQYHPQAQRVVVAANGCFRYQQRRQHERYRCEMQVHLRCVGDPDWTSGICRDISAGGARIYLPREFVLRSNTLEVVFLSPANQQAVRAIAEVVRASKLLDEAGWELGIRFTEMNRMEKIHFARLLQHWASFSEHEPIQP